MSEATASERVRLRFAKQGKIRFTSHRDVARLWERTLRRANAPLAWSQGFSPRPLLSFGLALPTGCESVAEYLDIRLEAPLDVADKDWSAHLNTLLPQGISVLAEARLSPDTQSLQQEVTLCTWELEVFGVSGGDLTTRIERCLAASNLVVTRERKGRHQDDDIRTMIHSLSFLGDVTNGDVPGPGSCLRAELATQPRGVRPVELLAALGLGDVPARSCRTHQWIERDGVRLEPLSLGTGPVSGVAPHASERAS